jgi:hypothetical protein
MQKQTERSAVLKNTYFNVSVQALLGKKQNDQAWSKMRVEDGR